MSSVFSSRLISLRKERQMTQTDLANALHKTRSTISGYETEGKEPDYDMLCSIAKYFGVTIDYLLGVAEARTESEVVFINDTNNFKRHYDALPPLTKQTVAKLYDCFYLLLSRDMQNNNAGRLEVYLELFSVLQSSRADIRKLIDSCDGQVSDPLLLSDLIALQNGLKTDVSAVLDKLMQADVDNAFDVKKGNLTSSESKVI